MVSAVFFPTVWIDEDKLPKSIQTLRKLERLEENKPQISRVAVIRENKFILAFSPKNVQFANDFMNYYFMPLLKAAIYRHWTITDPDEELGPGARKCHQFNAKKNQSSEIKNTNNKIIFL